MRQLQKNTCLRVFEKPENLEENHVVFDMFLAFWLAYLFIPVRFIVYGNIKIFTLIEEKEQ